MKNTEELIELVWTKLEEINARMELETRIE